MIPVIVLILALFSTYLTFEYSVDYAIFNTMNKYNNYKPVNHVISTILTCILWGIFYYYTH